MLIDIFPMDQMPDFMVWMDWKLYQYVWMFIFNTGFSLFFYPLLFEIIMGKGRGHIILNLKEIFVICNLLLFLVLYILDGPGVG